MSKKAKALIITTTFVMMALGGVVLAVDNYPYFDPKDAGYGIELPTTINPGLTEKTILTIEICMTEKT